MVRLVLIGDEKKTPTGAKITLNSSDLYIYKKKVDKRQIFV